VPLSWFLNMNEASDFFACLPLQIFFARQIAKDRGFQCDQEIGFNSLRCPKMSVRSLLIDLLTAASMTFVEWTAVAQLVPDPHQLTGTQFGSTNRSGGRTI
jgi:hypothetical protein